MIFYILEPRKIWVDPMKIILGIHPDGIALGGTQGDFDWIKPGFTLPRSQVWLSPNIFSVKIITYSQKINIKWLITHHLFI
jgi:hypothetical protein